jgi:hypothetical protein
MLTEMSTVLPAGPSRQGPRPPARGAAVDKHGGYDVVHEQVPVFRRRQVLEVGSASFALSGMVTSEYIATNRSRAVGAAGGDGRWSPAATGVAFKKRLALIRPAAETSLSGRRQTRGEVGGEIR